MYTTFWPEILREPKKVERWSWLWRLVYLENQCLELMDLPRAPIAMEHQPEWINWLTLQCKMDKFYWS